MSTPYWTDCMTTLYCGDCRIVLPRLLADGLAADLIVTDPPYESTSLPWDRWPDGWPTLAATAARSMWCFGSLRMFGAHWSEFITSWRLAQDVIWEKHAGSGPGGNRRLLRVHELVCHWYRGQWNEIYAEPEPEFGRPGASIKPRARRAAGGEARGVYSAQRYVDDDGSRLPRSVRQVRSMQGRAIHPAEKPVALLSWLIRYGCPPGGLVLDLFAGSGSTLDAARQSGRRALGIEADERYAELAACRLSAGILDFGEVVP